MYHGVEHRPRTSTSSCRRWPRRRSRCRYVTCSRHYRVVHASEYVDAVRERSARSALPEQRSLSTTTSGVTWTSCCRCSSATGHARRSSSPAPRSSTHDRSGGTRLERAIRLGVREPAEGRRRAGHRRSTPPQVSSVRSSGNSIRRREQPWMLAAADVAGADPPDAGLTYRGRSPTRRRRDGGRVPHAPPRQSRAPVGGRSRDRNGGSGEVLWSAPRERLCRRSATRTDTSTIRARECGSRRAIRRRIHDGDGTVAPNEDPLRDRTAWSSRSIPEYSPQRSWPSSCAL